MFESPDVLLKAADSICTHLRCGSSRSLTGGPGGAGTLVSLCIEEDRLKPPLSLQQDTCQSINGLCRLQMRLSIAIHVASCLRNMADHNVQPSFAISCTL